MSEWKIKAEAADIPICMRREIERRSIRSRRRAQCGPRPPSEQSNSSRTNSADRIRGQALRDVLLSHACPFRTLTSLHSRKHLETWSSAHLSTNRHSRCSSFSHTNVTETCVTTAASQTTQILPTSCLKKTSWTSLQVGHPTRGRSINPDLREKLKGISFMYFAAHNLYDCAKYKYSRRIACVCMNPYVFTYFACSVTSTHTTI